MLDSTLPYVIIRTLPESILFMLAGFILLDLKIDKIKILKSGLILGVIVTVIRTLPIAYGIHTVLAMIIGGAILTKITKLPLAQPVMATCGIFIALAMSEGVYVLIAELLFGISINDLTETNALGAIKSLPSLFIFISIVIAMKFIQGKFKSKTKTS